MVRDKVEFARNDYKNFVATWKYAHSGKIRMQNYVYILITTIITYDFSCTGVVRDHISSVRVRTISYIIIKENFLFSMFIMQSNKVLNMHFTKLLASIKYYITLMFFKTQSLSTVLKTLFVLLIIART